MATFAQWARSDRKPRRITWVCGPEPVLAAEAVVHIRAAVGGTQLTIGAAVAGERAVWDACAQFPAPGEVRLVVVRDAEMLARWEVLEEIAQAGREFAGGHVVLVSSEPGYTRRTDDGKELLPGPAIVQASPRGQVIRCVMSAEDKTAWVRERLPGKDRVLAYHILVRADGDLAVARDVCTSLAINAAHGIPPSEAAVNTLCEAQSLAPFEDSLIGGSRLAALQAIPAPDDLGRVLGVLASRLDVLGVLYGAWKQELGPREIVAKTGVPQLLMAKYRTAAREYPPERVLGCRRLLAELDGPYRSGEREGIAEALVALW